MRNFFNDFLERVSKLAGSSLMVYRTHNFIYNCQ